MPDAALVIAASRARTQQIVFAGRLHDLNGPLNNLRLTLELLERALAQRRAGAASDADSRVRRYLDTLAQESGRVAAWSRDAAATIGDPSPQAEAGALAALIEEAGGLFRHPAALAEVRIEAGAPLADDVRIADVAAVRALLATFLCAAIAMAPAGAVVSLDGAAGDADATLRITIHPARVPADAARAFERPPQAPESPLEVDLLAGRLRAEALRGEATLGIDAGRATIDIALPRV